MGTPGDVLLVSQSILQVKEPGLPGEIVHSRFGEENTQDESENCVVQKVESAKKYTQIQ